METQQINSSNELLSALGLYSIDAPFGAEANLASEHPKLVEVVRPPIYFVTGVISVLNAQGEPLVEFGGNPTHSPIKARTTVRIRKDDVGRQVVIFFDHGDVMRPIILGMLDEATKEDNALTVELDGEKVVLSASREIVLRCGGASITLTRAGKVLIQGEYVLTRSKGVNRVKGASVQIN